jgi:L-ascorbate metabolism protein UlaG (beta-lactamase superfamily)
MRSITIQYLRTSMLLISWDGRSILTDPWFAMHMRGLPVFVKPRLRPEQLPPLDMILASHLHPDHFDDRALAKLAFECPLIVGPPGTGAKSRKARCGQIAELVDGDGIEHAGFTVKAFSVRHSGYENAYSVTRDGMTLLFAGDARYTNDFKRIGLCCAPLVSLLPVGGTTIMGRRIVMNPRDALRAAHDLKTKVAVPMHCGGEWMSVPPLSRHPGRARHMAALAESTGSPVKVAALAPGEKVRVFEDGSVGPATE